MEHEAVGAETLPLRVPVVQTTVDPSLMLTVPVGVLLPLLRVTVAVKVTELPYVDGLSDELIVVEVPALAVNVAVIAGLLPDTLKLHGLVVDVHPEKFDGALHPAKKELELGVTVNVPVALLLERVEPPVHVLVTVCDVAALPVPPHVVGELTVPV